ncbi:hypothetical protein [Psychromonas sp.]|uniref:hypothetical protein n=1 Tax=Psychromonas sp. TaxID=1884585 RepID=UPI0035636BFA
MIEDNYVPAETQVQEYMQTKGWTEGWEKNKKRLFVVNTETFNTEDPSYDDSFVTKRSQYALIATMGAKAKIVEFMRTEMSAVDQITAPGTDVHAELNKKYETAVNKIEKQQQKLVKLLAEVDAAEADKLRGVTWSELYKRYYEGLIKKLDETYSAGDIEAKKLATYEKTKKKYDEAAIEMQEIEAKAASIKGTVSLESTSVVETLAKAPLMGASILLQAESWNEEEDEYEVSTLMVWSPKLEQAAKAVVTGENYPLKPKNGLSVQDWLNTQELATLVGPRQYVDKDGQRWFLGAYAMPVEGSSSLKRKNKGIADLFAKKETAMALYADIETHKQAAIALQTRSAEQLQGKDNTEVATSFAEQTRQSIENRPVSGLSKLLSKTMVHPISQQKIHLVVYGISGSSASEALKMESSAYQSAAAGNRAIQKSVADKKLLDKELVKSNAVVISNKESLTENTVSNNTAKSVVAHNKVKSNSQSLLNAPSIDEDDF